MKMLNLKEEEMYVFVAPDGTPQVSTMAADFASCVGFAELMAAKGLARHPAVLFNEGFMVLPVKVTMVQNGDENTAFKKK